MRRPRKYLYLSAAAVVGAALALALVLALPHQFAAAQDAAGANRSDAPASAAAAPSCRFGVDLWERLPVRDFDLAALRVGWYVDYYAPYIPGLPHPPGLDYAPVLRLKQVGSDNYLVSKSWATIDALLAANPGAFWLIGNEPDRRALQDDIEPAIYASAYHDLYTYLKQRDPTAQVLAGNIVQPSPLRLQYLDLVLAAYQNRYGAPMPVDGWAIHAFLLNERSCAAFPADCWGAEIPPGITATTGLVLGYADVARLDLFTAQIARFRDWMADNGYRSRPLYITEFGVLLPPRHGYEPPVVNRFMRAAFDYLLTARDNATGYPPDENRLVQRFAWYAVVEPIFNGGLFEGISSTYPISPPYILSPIGLNYQAYTAKLNLTAAPHLLAAAVAPPFPLPAAQNGEFTASLAITIANAGDLAAPAAVTVAVYDGAPEPGATPLAAAQTVSVGGCGGSQVVVLHWRSPVSGARRGFLTVAANSANNSTTLTLPYFAPRQKLFLPWLAGLPAGSSTAARQADRAQADAVAHGRTPVLPPGRQR